MTRMALLAVVVLVGCARAQTSLGTMPWTALSTPSQAYRASGMYSQVLYVYGDFVQMLTYPGLNLIASFPQSDYVVPDCTDDVTGSVYFLGFKGVKFDDLVSYPIGSTVPTGTLSPPADTYFGECNSDPTTGNLAVLIDPASQSGPAAYVGVYPPGSTSPQQFSDPNMTAYFSLSYDGQGNLFVEGDTATRALVLSELPRGSSQFTELSISGGKLKLGDLEWDGSNLAVRLPPTERNRRRVLPPTIQRIAISGSSAKILGRTTLLRANLGTWIQGDTVLSGEFRHQHEGTILFYHYPAGGKPYAAHKGLTQEIVTLMIATAQSR